MIEDTLGRKFTRLLVKTYYLHFVVVFFNKTPQSQSKTLIRPYAPIHGVERPWGDIFVDFFSLSRCRRHLSESLILLISGD
uniref:Uncharacterized protein n=1 Tax=Lutzomyia longipalpis TaxID=7200 RepID=A0A7G3B418_LUTLO